jgi:DNA excision repair protein ERCC-3
MDIPLLDFPVPDGDILTFLLESIGMPQEGEVIQELRIKKLQVTHLDCLTQPTEAKQRQRANNTKNKAGATQQEDNLFGALAKQAWDSDGGVPLPKHEPSPSAGAPNGMPSSSTPSGGLSAKQASNYSLVFDKKTNVDEWELVRKAVYVIGKWLGDDFALVCLGAFLEVRERKEADLLRFLGFLPTTNAADKEQWASMGLPDISDTRAKREKKEIKAKLASINARNLLRSRHMPDRENIIIWHIDLLNLLNSAIYRIHRLKSKITECVVALRTDIMYCPHCATRFPASQIQQLQRRGNNYLCNPPCNTILQMIDTQDLLEKYGGLQKKIPQFDVLNDLLSEFRDRGQSKSKTSGSGAAKRDSSSSSSDKAKVAAGGAAKGKGLARSGAHPPHPTKAQPPSFMTALVNTQSTEHQRIQDTKQECFSIHPITFGDATMEDYRVFIPVIDDLSTSEREIGFRSAKLLLDNVADFLHMVKQKGNDFYQYCYNISLRSLFIAHKRGFRPTEILRYLNNMSAGVPPCIIDRVMDTSKYHNYYPASMVLVNCRYFVRSSSLETIKQIQNIETVGSYLVPPGGQILKTEDSSLGETFYWLEVQKDNRSLVKERAYEKGIPIIDEYCFVTETSSLAAEIEPPSDIIRMKKVPVVLTPVAGVRDYQSMSCSKLYWDSFRCHSGILILPCGAGKTLIGITAFATLQQPCIIFCQSTLAASQWAEQIGIWTNLSKSAISAITSLHKDRNPDAEVVITTYAMFAGNELKRKDESVKIINRIRQREWGLMILDEVHQAPADTFRIVTGKLTCHLKLGLTATLVREDAKVAMLPSLVGPTLYELDVSTLRKRGHIASIECHEIRLPFTPFWKHHYTHPAEELWRSTSSTPAVVKELLFTTNPNKMLACMTLIKKHLQERHKIVIFCDDLIGLDCYAKILGSIDTSRPCPVIHGKTTETDKERIVKQFRDAQHGDWLLFSKVGDMSIDLPEARVLIQIAASQGSRMQEGQRIGRIQRKFPGKTLSYAYSLVSGESETELGFAYRRRNYLEDHGYSVQIHEMDESPNYIKSQLDTTIENQLVMRIREMLQERSMARSSEGKAKLKAERARRQPGFKRGHDSITPTPGGAGGAAGGAGRDLSMMKALKKFKR